MLLRKYSEVAAIPAILILCPSLIALPFLRKKIGECKHLAYSSTTITLLKALPSPFTDLRWARPAAGSLRCQ